MAIIDPTRHPLLHEVAQGAQWIGTDEFPSCLEWANEHEAWLRFVNDGGALHHYLPRLRGPKERRDEAFAEIAPAYFFGTKCGLSVFEWEPTGANGKRGEFLMGFDRRQPVFVEVKAPGWEDEIVKTEGRASARLQQPKHIQAEARATGPWASVRHAVAKAYPKMPDTLPTLLVINDDLMVSLSDWSAGVTEIALYAPHLPGATLGYSAQDGPFVNNRYERLGAVGVFNVRLVSGIEYRLRIFENPHALPAVAVPPEVADGYTRYNGTRTAPATLADKPWFAEILKDPEWLRDPAGKARAEAMKTLAELEARRPHENPGE
jgi:hypothetical protein